MSGTRSGVSVVALVLVSLGLAGCPTVTVPDLVGMEQPSAFSAVSEAGLVLGRVAAEYNDSIDEGLVCRQQPEAGAQVDAGSTIELFVSDGPAPPVVPDVVGMPQALANTAIRGAGLTVGPETLAYSSTVTAGYVISQVPGAGVETTPGAVVSLTISNGPRIAIVPDLTGMTLAAAISSAQQAMVQVGSYEEEHSDSVAAGCVIRQEPEAGAEVWPWTPIHVVVSLGPPPVRVPYVKGMTEAQARATLTSAGLVAGEVTEETSTAVPAGRIMHQQPEAGLEVDYGTTVDLTKSRGPANAVVPDVVGLMQNEAKVALEAAGFSLGAVTELYAPDRPFGEVLAQYPSPGAPAILGDAIDVDVASDTFFIYTIEELQQIGHDPAYPLDAPYALANDIDASATPEWNNGYGFLPLARYDTFYGKLDGRGHVITGLSIRRNYPGAFLFGHLGPGSRIFDLTLRDGYLSGESAAGIAEKNEGEISNCRVDLQVCGKYWTSAGIAVYNAGGTIRNCEFAGHIEETYYAGGVAAFNRGFISACRVSGLISGAYAGGIVAENQYSYSDTDMRTPVIEGCICSGQINANDRAGGIAGVNHGLISRCAAVGPIMGLWEMAAGIAAENYYHGRVEQSYASGMVFGYESCGGLVAFGYPDSSISDCFVAGPVYSKYGTAGGLVDRNHGLIERCYATGSLSAPESCGGLVTANCGAVADSFWNGETSGASESDGGTEVTEEQLLSPYTFIAAGWDFTEADGNPPVWAQTEGVTVPYLYGSPGGSFSISVSAVNGSVETTPAADVYPAWSLVTLRPVEAGEFVFAGWTGMNFGDTDLLPLAPLTLVVDGPLELQASFQVRPAPVGSIEELQRIGTVLTCPLDWDYYVTNDIDASETVSWNDGAGFEPIGPPNRQFSGEFDGRGHTISGLYINRPDESAIGLFKHAARDSIIRDVSILGAEVTGDDTVGILAGTTEGNVTNVETSGAVNGYWKAGGLAGMLSGDAVRISACSSTAALTSYYTAGGLIGASSGRCLVESCFASGPVVSEGAAGGLVGHGSGGTIAHSYATGDVSGASYAGGLVAYVDDCDISSSRAHGNVEGNHAGGLVGVFLSREAKIRDCYSTSDVSGGTDAGGLCGYLNGIAEESCALGSVTAGEFAGGFAGNIEENGYSQDCYAAGPVSGTLAGGFAGLVTGGTLWRCYSSGVVSGDPEAGGLVGAGEDAVCYMSCWDTDTSGQIWSAFGTGMTTEEMTSAATFTGLSWDLTHVWNIEEGASYPYLRWESSPLE